MARFLLLLLALLAPLPARAACFADYKAKQEDPLRLHYGVAELNQGCDRDSARAELDRRLAQAGWTLLTIVSVFDETGLEERRASAGQNFLRF
ncbi:hypothetical protein [Roseivivax isoporae]|nr:hypothetical protein [Roseivivax isoporae]